MFRYLSTTDLSKSNRSQKFKLAKSLAVPAKGDDSQKKVAASKQAPKRRRVGPEVDVMYWLVIERALVFSGRIKPINFEGVHC